MRNKPRLPILQRSHPLARGLVGAWLFHEGAGNRLRGLSNYGNHSNTFAGNPVWTDQGLKFDGSGDYINIPNSPSFDFGSTTNFSAFVLIKRGDIGRQQFMLDQRASGAGPGWIFYFSAVNVLTVNFNGNFLASIGTIADTTTYHSVGFRAARAADVLRFFIDGQPDSATLDISGAGTTSNAGFLTIGSRAFTQPSQDLNATIRAAYLYARALTPGEFAQLHADPYQAFRPRQYWPAVEVAAAPPAEGALLPILMQHGQYTGGTI